MLCNILHRKEHNSRDWGFFVIDGVSLFEKAQWRAENKFVFGKLREAVTDPTMNVVVKLLATIPGISRAVKEMIRPDNRLWVPRDGISESGIFPRKGIS